MIETYKGWKIDFDMKPIPDRRHDWEATHEDYDGTNGLHITGESLRDLYEQIDEWEFDDD